MNKVTAKENLDFPGFYEIPGYGKYVVSVKGEVINKRKKKKLWGSISNKGYVLFRLSGDDGNFLTIGRHRLLGMVFKHPGVPIEGLVINHIDGIPGNDDLDNLEWVTYQGNIEHAGQNGLTEKCIPLSVRDVLTGIVYNFPSIQEFARQVGWSKDKINWRIKAGEDRVFPELLQYRRGDITTPWIVPGNIEQALLENFRLRKTLLRYVLTGDVLEFQSLTEAAAHLGVCKATASNWINLQGQPILPGLVQLKFARDTTPWRNVSDPYLEYELFSKQRVICVKETSTGEERFFLSSRECCQEMSISREALEKRLKSHMEIADRYVYSYYSDAHNA